MATKSKRNLSGVVTFLSDFGSSDTYVAEVKGVILCGHPNAVFVDVTHAIPPFDIERGAFSVLRSYRHFPAGTIHLAVVDPGVGSARECLVVYTRHHTFVGPNNGLLLWAVRDCERRDGVKAEAFRIPVPEMASATFHGRDVFAPFIAELLNGKSPKLTQSSELIGRAFPAPEHNTIRCTGEVLCSDHYGNLVTTIPVGYWPQAKEAWLKDVDNDIHLSATYSQIPDRKLGLIAGSHGFWEIAGNRKSAAQAAKVGPGHRVILS